MSAEVVERISLIGLQNLEQQLLLLKKKKKKRGGVRSVHKTPGQAATYQYINPAHYFHN